MIKRAFVTEIFRAADMRWWGDKIRPVELRESFKTYVNKKGDESKLYGEKAKKPRPYNIGRNPQQASQQLTSPQRI